MVFLFMAIWAFGAALLLLCCALIWSERLTVLQTVPACAKCGYDVTGLPRGGVCPECGARERKYTKALEYRRTESRIGVSLLTIPTVCGLLVSIPLVLVSQATSPDNVIAVAGNTAAFIACGVMVRVMLGWITRAAAHAILWCCIGCLTAALAAVTADALYASNINATADEVLVFAPALIAPFAGYGLALGILVHARLQARIVSAPRGTTFRAWV